MTIRISLNSHLAGIGNRPTAFGDLVRFIADNPAAKFIAVPATSSSRGAGKTSPADLAGSLARRAVEEDACIIFDPKTPKRILQAVERKFNYIVIRGRDPLDAGGILRGYQIPHRLFAGDLGTAKKVVEEIHALREAKRDEREAEAKLRAERVAKKAAGRARAEADYRAAQERRRKMEEIVNGSKPVAQVDPIFSQGSCEFKFRYKTSDNVDHVDVCRANNKDEAFQKLRTVRIRPIKLWCEDAAVPPEPSRTGADPAARLRQLDALKAEGLITEAEYAEKRSKIIAEL